MAPGLAWEALLKTASEYCEHEAKCKDCELCQNEFRLQLLKDIVILNMFEKYIQDCITEAVKRYAKASNKYITDQYNPDEKSTIFII